MTKHKFIGFSCLLLSSVLNNSVCFADESPEAIQKKLNAQVLGQSFSVADEATLNSALNAATERGKPSHSTPTYSGAAYYNSYYQPYYGYGVSYYRPYHYSYTPYYWGYW